MTSAEFSRKYNLLKCVSEQGARTYLAEQKGLTRGRIVMVHYLDVGSRDDTQHLLERVGALSTAAMDKVVETTEVDAVPVVVTLFIQPFESLPAWLDQHATGTAAAKKIGDFTRMFEQPSPSPRTQPSAPPPPPAAPKPQTPPPIAHTAPSAPPPKPPTPTPAHAPPTGPGDFTRAFGGVQLPPQAPAYATPMPSAPPQPSQTPPRMPPVMPPPPQPQARAGGAGEFTRIFGKVDEPHRMEEPPEPMLAPVVPLAPVDEPLAPPAPAPKSGGEGFTQLFERLSSTPTPPPIAPAKAIGTSAPNVTQPPAMPGKAPSMPAASVPPATHGGSEYTQMMGRLAPSSGTPTLPNAPQLGAPSLAAPNLGLPSPNLGSAPPVPQAAPPAEAPKAVPSPTPSPNERSKLVLVIALGGMFVVAIVLLLILLLR